MPPPAGWAASPPPTLRTVTCAARASRNAPMSNLEPRPAAHELGGLAAVSARPALDLLPGKEVLLGESTHVRRLLPTLGRRLVGAWAFVDQYGPDDVAGSAGMPGVPPPPPPPATGSRPAPGGGHHPRPPRHG